MRAVNTLGLRMALAFTFGCVIGCDSDRTAAERTLGDKLSDRVSLKIGMLVENSLPEASDGTVNLVDLGPAIILEPGGVSLLGFEVQDSEDRDVVATLLQFSGASGHLRGPVDDVDEGPVEDPGKLIENELTATDGLCEDLCAGVLTVTAKLAVELDDGAISDPIEIDLAIDCRGADGEPACEPEPGEDELPGLVCGDVTDGETALTGDSELDTYFDALRMLASVAAVRSAAVDDDIAEVMTALELVGSDTETIAGELQARFTADTEAGVMVLWGDPGCGVRARRALHTLRACDPEGTRDEAPAMGCEGVCEHASPCEDSLSNGCRGFLDDAGCDGECTGACQEVLTEPTACAGTCFGTCEGVCPGADPTGSDCAGPCAGLCDGECRELHGGACGGACTGLCDEAMTDPTDCDSALRSYCGSPEGSSLVCFGECFGVPSFGTGSEICQASAVAEGQLAARCDSPIVHLAFGFAMDTDAAQQEAFADLVGEVDGPITRLLGALAQLEQIELAASLLLDAATGPVAARIADDDLDTEAQQCAEDTMDAATPWLTAEVLRLSALRGDILAITGALTPIEAP